MNRQSLLLCLVLGWLLAGCASAPTACDESLRPVRRFPLRYQEESFVVPEGATWKLTWRSPYSPGEITPGYDVRIIEGQARLGKRGELIARAFDSRPGNAGFLDLQAVIEETTVVWLEAGTRFETANDLVNVRVEEIPQPISCVKME